MAYFERTGVSTYRPTAHVGGAWKTSDQHIAPALGLLAHEVERDRDARGREELALSRLSYDIWGTVPLEDVETVVQVRRPGRTIELVEAELSHAGRRIATLRAWLMQRRETADLAATALPLVPGPDATPVWDPTDVWPGGFIASAEVRRMQDEPGRAHFWVRTDLPLLADEHVTPLARAAGLLDIANGMTVRADPEKVAFPNVDLTAHVFREPSGDWLGFDTTVSFGPTGIGLTHSVLHDTRGPYGAMSQVLTVRPA
jgi:Thioesterase-like superfamily